MESNQQTQSHSCAVFPVHHKKTFFVTNDRTADCIQNWIHLCCAITLSSTDKKNNSVDYFKQIQHAYSPHNCVRRLTVDGQNSSQTFSLHDDTKALFGCSHTLTLENSSLLQQRGTDFSGEQPELNNLWPTSCQSLKPLLTTHPWEMSGTAATAE